MNEAQKACLEIISSVYTDGIDAIGEPELDDDESILTCQFQDGTKFLEAKIFLDKDENNIEIKMLNPDDIDEYDPALSNSAPSGPAEDKAKNYTTGKPCGDTCVSKNKECEQEKSILFDKSRGSPRSNYQDLIAFSKDSLAGLFDHESAVREEAKIKDLVAESNSLQLSTRA